MPDHRNPSCVAVAALFIWMGAGGLAPSAQGETIPREQADFFESKIRPVLMSACVDCHGPEKSEAGLRVDRRADLIKGGDSGPAVLPGDPDNSPLIGAIRGEHPETEKPIAGAIKDRTVADFTRWVREGANWPADREPTESSTSPEDNAGTYWAFQPITRPDVPGGKDNESPIDAFLRNRYEAKGLEPVDRADKRTLIRRATYDLIGLPPTPEEVRAFLDDDSPEAFAHLVDRLLASPEYGRRWGRHWLDIARYADTSGDGTDMPIPEARLYRDYVIDAFNRDMPYDQFLVEQIAGDILAEKDPDDRYAEKIIATGYIALSRRFGNSKLAEPEMIIENTLDTIGRGVLGMTLSCARCHDHKFDPIPTKDYYGLYGYFKSTQYPHPGTEHDHNRSDFPFLVPPDQREDDADTPIAYAVSDKEEGIGNARVQRGGNRHQLGDEAPRGFLSVIDPSTPDIPEEASGRLQFARWIASPDNPLTARVMANRIWHYHFGKGIVGTTDDFGVQGNEPTHPQLLDHLAAEFIESGWSIKAMHRKIMLSDAYQRASTPDESNLAVDPTNALYWRFDRRRLEAEAIRDAMLFVSGGLNLSPGGEHPFPPEKEWERINQHNPFSAVYEHNKRSVYLMTQRLSKHPILGLFDGPDTNQTTGDRAESTVPLQALFMMNSDFIRDSAQRFADRLLQTDREPAQAVRRAYELAYARPPADEEQRNALDYLQHYAEDLAEKDESLDEAARQHRAWTSLARILLSSNEFVYID